jgi:hypothetical protein
VTKPKNHFPLDFDVPTFETPAPPTPPFANRFERRLFLFVGGDPAEAHAERNEIGAHGVGGLVEQTSLASWDEPRSDPLSDTLTNQLVSRAVNALWEGSTCRSSSRSSTCPVDQRI